MKRLNSFKLLLFVFALIVYGIFAYAFGNESICIFKVYAGLPCPGCGMTRSFLSLLSGHMDQAFYWHPLWPLVLIAPVLYGILDRQKASQAKKNALIWFVLGIFIMTYGYRMYLYFPHQPPMDFNKHSYFYQIYEAL